MAMAPMVQYSNKSDVKCDVTPIFKYKFFFSDAFAKPDFSFIFFVRVACYCVCTRTRVRKEKKVSYRKFMHKFSRCWLHGHRRLTNKRKSCIKARHERRSFEFCNEHGQQAKQKVKHLKRML